jgi:SNF2 family DNA or RNA helicase
MLRRQKNTEIDGKPIINLPPKHIALDNVEFSDDEMAIYKALETKSKIKMNKYLDKDSVSGKSTSISGWKDFSALCAARNTARRSLCLYFSLYTDLH